MTNESLHVAVIDIGKLANLGWVVEGPSVTTWGEDVDECIEALAEAMKVGPLALGFEGPMLFVPYGRKRANLDDARNGDEDRSGAALRLRDQLSNGATDYPVETCCFLRRSLPMWASLSVTLSARGWRSSGFLRDGKKEPQSRMPSTSQAL
jgi:hypothetical protein